MQIQTFSENHQHSAIMAKLILVVDDTPDLLEGLREFLQMEGYDVVSATNGQEALDVLDAMPVDLIITDLLMPVMDGFQLIRSVKQRDDFRNTPIIVFSAKPRHENVETLLQIGASKFVSKPSDLENILLSVKELIHE